MALEKPGIDLLGEGVEAGEGVVIFTRNCPPQFGKHRAWSRDLGIAEDAEGKALPGPGGVADTRVQVEHRQSVETLFFLVPVDVDLQRAFQTLPGGHVGVIPLPADPHVPVYLTVDFQSSPGPGKFHTKRVAMDVA